MKLAVALLLEIPDGAALSLHTLDWEAMLNAGAQHPILGNMQIKVERVESHSDPDAIFAA